MSGESVDIEERAVFFDSGDGAGFVKTTLTIARKGDREYAFVIYRGIDAASTIEWVREHG